MFMKRSKKILIFSCIAGALCIIVAITLTIVLLPNTNQTVSKISKYQLNRLSKRLNGKNISILGDSITTYEGFSDNANYNSTLSPVANISYYTSGNGTIADANDTWWMMVVNDLNVNLLVNNSCSGLRITYPWWDDGVKKADNLHRDTGSLSGTVPDIVFVYLGTNDVFANNEVGNFEDIRWNELISEVDGTYAEPSNVVEAYAIILHKIKTLYNNPDIFCLNVLENQFGSVTEINCEIAKVVEHFGANLVDIANKSGINQDTLTQYTMDTVHPNEAGMELIAHAVERALIKKYL